MRCFAASPVVFLTVVAACGSETNPNPNAGGAAAAGHGGTNSSGASSGGASNMSGAGMGGASMGMGGNGAAAQGGASSGATSTGGGINTGGSVAMSGSAGTGGNDVAGGSNGGGIGGAPSAGSAGDAAGGISGGMGGDAAGGMGGGSDGIECTREFLRNTVEAYFEALAAQDPASLPLASDVRFTENGEELELGEAGLWTTAGELKYSHSAVDPEICTSATQAVVADGNMDIPFALRLRSEAGEIVEIETIAVRPGDYSLASNTADLMASNDSVGWEEEVPAAERNTHEEISGWMDKYFRMFPSGVCNVTNDCTRIENGGGSFACTAGASCAPGDPGPNDNALVPRLIFADVEAGLGVGFTMFMGHTDMHIFKMYGGQIHGVSAILAEAPSPGWD